VILVIDDEPSITELLSDILEYQGHPVVIANDVQSAMDVLAFHRPDLILVDLMMPSVDGLSLAMTLRHMPTTRTIPLIAMSASDSALAIADRVGDFDAQLGKPFETDELLQLIERYLPIAS